MARSESWDPAHAPGTGHFAYANLNFPIVASVMEMATGERFDHLMKRLVIGPMNLDACFNWPGCSDAAIARAVVLTQDGKPIRDDLGGKRPPCPVYVRDGEACDLNRWKLGDNGALFSPQGGLRISARDLARVGRMLLSDGTIDGVQILSATSVDAMLAPAWRFDGANGSRDGESETICAYGLAVHLLASGRPAARTTRKAAAAPGLAIRATLMACAQAYGSTAQRGVGIAYFVSGLPENPPRGRSAFRKEEERAFQRAVKLIGR